MKSMKSAPRFALLPLLLAAALPVAGRCRRARFRRARPGHARSRLRRRRCRPTAASWCSPSAWSISTPTRPATVAVDRRPVRARRGAAGAADAGRLERQFAGVLARRQDACTSSAPSPAARSCTRSRPPAARRSSSPISPLDVGGYKLSPDGKRVAFSAEAFADCKAATWPARKKQLDEREASKTTRRGLRPHVHPPLGHLERRPPQPRVRRAASGRRQGAAERGDAGRRRRDRRRAVQAVRRQQRSTPGRPMAAVLVLSARMADAQEPWSTNFDLYQLNADGSGARRTSPPPTRPGTPARCSAPTARPCTTAR